MHLDTKLSIDQASAGRDHRTRANTAIDQAQDTSPGTPKERTVAGGPTPVSRAEQQPLREDTTDPDDKARTEARRRKAEQHLEQAMRLPADTRLEIHIDVESEEVRFQIRERSTGKLVREVPPDLTKPLLRKLDEFSGVLVDRSL